MRRRPEAERFAFLGELLDIHPIVALKLARICLVENPSFEALLSRGLDEADASTIKYWLDSVVPRLGFRKVVVLLRERARENGEGVRKALDWLPRFSELPGYSGEAVTSLRASLGDRRPAVHWAADARSPGADGISDDGPDLRA